MSDEIQFRWQRERHDPEAPAILVNKFSVGWTMPSGAPVIVVAGPDTRPGHDEQSKAAVVFADAPTALRTLAAAVVTVIGGKADLAQEFARCFDEAKEARLRANMDGRNN